LSFSSKSSFGRIRVTLRLAVGHSAAESSAAGFFGHELRWARTVRLVNPIGHLGTLVTFGFPFALLSALLTGFSPVSLWALGLTLAARLFLKQRIDDTFGTYAGPYWLLPVRDLLSFAVFVTSLSGRTVRWRESRFTVAPSGAMSQS
jgi:ceramide glucosyltransferase